MKVELQCGDTIAIPEGCKAVVKDGSIVFEKEEKIKVQKFKDGDVLHSVYSDTILIFKEEDEDNSTWFYSHYNTDCGGINGSRNSVAFRHATEEEKQQLFDKMKERGLLWNAEEKRVEKIRWRAKKGERYFVLYRTAFEVDCYTESFDEIDAKLYNCGNYFRTKEQAEEAAKRVKETLRKYHEEIGE